MIPTWVLNVKEFSQSSLQWREYQELVNAETAEVMEVWRMTNEIYIDGI